LKGLRFRFIVTLLLLIALSASGLAQIGIGGGGSNWQILYKINGASHYTVYDPDSPPAQNSDVPWNPNPDWQPDCVLGPFMTGFIKKSGCWAVGYTGGTVQIKVTWQGPSSQRPDHVWLKILSAASWSGNDGSCLDDQSDAEIDVEEPPGIYGYSVGTHIKKYPVPTSGIVQFSLSPSAFFYADVQGTSWSNGVGLAVSVTTREAAISRTDGGKVKHLDDGSIEAPTLRSWIGSKEEDKDDNGDIRMFDYSTIPAGAMHAENRGTYNGEWQTKMFPDPDAPGSMYSTGDVRVKWYGATINPSTDEFYPTSPRTTSDTTYRGDMPEATATQLWWYTLKEESGDYCQAELFCKWIPHYAAEDWSESGTFTYSDYGAWLATYPQSQLPCLYKLEHDMDLGVRRTVWDVIDHEPFLGFHLHRHHFKDAYWQEKLFDIMPCEFQASPAFPVTCWVTAFDPNWNGPYGVRVIFTGREHDGTVSLHTKLGNDTTNKAWIVPAKEWEFSLVCVKDDR
jgi:hypothetical protein